MINKKALFIFRRDLRISDNRGLIRALKENNNVIPCFIFDPRQVTASNAYRSENAIQFMIESLADLDQQLHAKDSKLYYFYGVAHEIVKKLIEQENISSVYTNRDYTPFSIHRDEAIKKVCIQHKISFIQEADLLLHEPEHVLSGNHTPYAIFTAFYKKALTQPIATPNKKIPGLFYAKPIKHSLSKKIFSKFLKAKNKHLWVKGGRTKGLTLLKRLSELENYSKTHDFPALSTSFLSAHLKFGTVSIRETYSYICNTLGKNHPLVRQLYWRDFFTHVAFHSPFVFGHAFHKQYDQLAWKNNKQEFKAWCEGKTGFPMVDAGMRQLNKTGWMHNRVRMIVASFLVKDLHIDWRWGEKYFAQQLIDYDPAVNNGNWQWSASTGADAQPYFRIFNPWIQQKKFDPHCLYIKKWIPELQDIDNKIIHTWFNSKNVIKNYPKPMINHAKESTLTKQFYKSHSL